MPSLLISLGTSWAVAPEAFHQLPPGPEGFSAVHVLTPASPKIDAGIAEVRAWFASRHPHVELTLSRVDGFTDLKSEADHLAFEEVLYRWMLEVAASVSRAETEIGTRQAPGTAASPLRSAQAQGSLPHVCLAGGFKTMSAAMQKAAAVLGAAEVFHVLADPLYPGKKGATQRGARSANEVPSRPSGRAALPARRGLEQPHHTQRQSSPRHPPRRTPAAQQTPTLPLERTRPVATPPAESISSVPRSRRPQSETFSCISFLRSGESRRHPAS